MKLVITILVIVVVWQQMEIRGGLYEIECKKQTIAWLRGIVDYQDEKIGQCNSGIMYFGRMALLLEKKADEQSNKTTANVGEHDLPRDKGSNQVSRHRRSGS